MVDKKILDTITNGLKYKFIKEVLVKPLPPVKVKKEITEQVPTGKVDENGYNEYDTKTEIKEVDSAFGTGIILALPQNPVMYEDTYQFKVGDKVAYNKKFAIDFDLFKDSQLVKIYDIVSIIED